MDVNNLAYPPGYAPLENDGPKAKRFKDLIWHNGEVCNNCFTQIRSIGDEVEKSTGLFIHRFNEHYERTEHGSQEHDPFVPAADRYGQCYCLNCGADTRAENCDLSLDVIQERALNILRYINTETPHRIDGEAMGRALVDFKSVPENQGYDSEILAVGTVVGIEANRQAGRSRAATAD
jgi:hypothetical protein